MKKFAVLIDADNSSHKHIEPVLEEVAKYGIASVKRIYGDWSVEALQSWRDKLLPHAITPVQQFAYVKQKDATDMRLVIDAMDLLFAGDLDGFCIVSSDSDFTPLASRIRESGLLVYGFGEKKTVNSFVNACDKFIYIENLINQVEGKSVLSKFETKSGQATSFYENSHKNLKSTSVNIDSQTLDLIYKAVKECTKDNGWASLSEVGSYISTVKPDFDTRTYEYSKLSELVDSLTMFVTKNIGKTVYVRKFSFSMFIRQVTEVIQNEKVKAGYWISINLLADRLYTHRKTNGLNNYSRDDILKKIDAINSSWIEFDQSRTKVRLPLDK